MSQVLTPRGSEVVTTAILQRRQSYTQNGGKAYDTITCAASSTTTSSGFNCATPFPRTEDPNQEDGNQCERYNGPAPPFLRLNSVQPFTLVFPVQSQQLNNLSVSPNYRCRKWFIRKKMVPCYFLFSVRFAKMEMSGKTTKL